MKIARGISSKVYAVLAGVLFFGCTIPVFAAPVEETFIPEEPEITTSSVPTVAEEEPERQILATKRQIELLAFIDTARELGFDEESETIQVALEAYDELQLELDILAKTISYEARGCTWDHKCAVGCVVMNRVADDRFPDNLYDVVAQPRQYNRMYLSGFDDTPIVDYKAAIAVLDGEYTIPENVVWQANFTQGKGVWWQSDLYFGSTFYSSTYFCY